jgi:tRNA-dihydrouridine synthase B
MAGITDAPFRKLCRRFGAGMTTSEMTTSDTSLWHTDKSRLRLIIDDDAEPRSIQIAGSEPGAMAEAAQQCVELGAQIIDINMGCPAKKVCNKAAGSALLQDEALVQKILEAVVGAVAVPVTLKIRTGWNPENRNGIRIAQIAEASGIQALAVHGRTRACRFLGEAEFTTIAQIKNTIKIPVIANGDIRGPEKSLEVLRVTGADALMIGRGAQGRPWVFRELIHYMKTGKKIAPLALSEVRDIMLDHLHDLHQFYGEEKGVRVARKHLNWYCIHLPNSGSFRNQVIRVQTASEQLQLTLDYFSAAPRDAILAA